MTEPQQQTIHADDEATLVVSGEETTLVAPRFDDEEALVARPVVPLDADAPADLAQDTPDARPAPVRRRLYAPRRSWTLALVLVSVLIGGVLGGAGLYLSQRQSHDPAVSPAAEPAQPETSADSAQQPTTAAEGQTVTPSDAPAPQTEAPAASEPNAEEPAPPARDEGVLAARPAREPETVPAAAERREAPAAGGSTATPRRGKKGDRDEEIERRAAPRTGGNVVRADEPVARQVDTIFYRQRRAERQAERRAARRARRDEVDRLRRIFEGTPQ